MDGHSYLAKMRQGWLGHWQFHLTYSSEPHQGAYIFLTYLAMGHLARFLGLPLVVIYHLARLGAGTVMLVTVYWFLSQLTDDVRERRLGFLLVSTSAGLGWLGAAFGRLPVDLWVPEGFAFFSLMTNPHFPLALALMLFLLGKVIWPGKAATRWLLPALSGLLLSLVLPFSLVPVFVTAGTFIVLKALLKWRAEHHQSDVRTVFTLTLRGVLPHIQALASAVLFSLPIVVYDYFVYTTNPALSAWASQNVTPAPQFVDLLLGYGLLVPLAVIGGTLVILRRQYEGELTLLVWGLGTVVLVYAPLSLQRRLIMGLGIPLALLAALAIKRWLMPLAGQRPWIPPLTTFLCATSSIFLLLVLSLGAVGNAQVSALPDSRLFLSSDETAAAAWLLHNAADTVVLADQRMGMFLPGLAGVRVVYGHEYETIDAETKNRAIEIFFSQQASLMQKQQIAARYGVQYILANRRTLPLESQVLPDTWVPVFTQGDIILLQVQ
jgi:hypothetical protein